MFLMHLCVGNIGLFSLQYHLVQCYNYYGIIVYK